MKHMMNDDPTKSLSTISFRGSAKDKEVMAEFAEKLQCSHSAVIRLSLRLLKEVNTSTFIPELFHRVHVYNVLRSGKNVVRFESVGETLEEYVNEEYVEQFDALLNQIVPATPAVIEKEAE